MFSQFPPFSKMTPTSLTCCRFSCLPSKHFGVLTEKLHCMIKRYSSDEKDTGNLQIFRATAYCSISRHCINWFAVFWNVAFSWQCHRSLLIFSLCKQYQHSIKNTNFHPTTVSSEVACIFKKSSCFEILKEYI